MSLAFGKCVDNVSWEDWRRHRLLRFMSEREADDVSLGELAVDVLTAEEESEDECGRDAEPSR
jgi:hypothetical protein